MVILQYSSSHISATLAAGIEDGLEYVLGDACSTSDTVNIKVPQKVLIYYGTVWDRVAKLCGCNKNETKYSVSIFVTQI